MNEELLQRLRDINPEPSTQEDTDELAAVFATIDARRSVMATEEKTATATENRQQSWRRGAMAFVGAIVIVLLIVGGGVLLLGRSVEQVAGDEPTSEAPPTTQAFEAPPPTTEAPPVTSDAPAVPVAPSSWTRVDVGDLVGGPVATGPMGMVAIEQNTEFSGGSWFSEDGESWQHLALPQGTDVAYGDPGFVICCHDTGHKGHFASREASSFSPDGIDWFTTPFDFDGSDQVQPGTYLSKDTVTFGNGKFVMLGEVIEVDDRLEAESYSLGVWHSDDGQNWTAQNSTAVPQDDLACITPPDCWNLDVTFGHAGFVAVGAGTWHSPDGTTWIRVQGPRFGDAWGCCSTVTYLNGAYFAIGGAEAQDKPRDAIWRSTDGLSWEMVLVNPDHGRIADVVYGDRGFLAVGWSGDTGAAVWHSTDGVTWTGPNHDPDVFTDKGFNAAGYIDGRYVIFGETNGADPPHGWVFISE